MAGPFLVGEQKLIPDIGKLIESLFVVYGDNFHHQLRFVSLRTKKIPLRHQFRVFPQILKVFLL